MIMQEIGHFTVNVNVLSQLTVKGTRGTGVFAVLEL